MLFEYTATITCSDAGAATVYLGSRIRGTVEQIKYEPTSIATGAGLTLTGETTGVPVLVKAAAGTATVWYYPRAAPNQNTDGAAEADFFEKIWLYQERLKLVVAAGGNATVGVITVYVDEEQ